MNKLLRSFIAIAMAVSALLQAGATENRLIAFNAAIPGANKTKVSGEEALKMVDDGADWLNSIDCTNVAVTSGRAGLTMTAPYNSGNPLTSTVKFVFGGELLMNATRIHLIGGGTMLDETPVTLKVNGKPVELKPLALLQPTDFPATVQLLDERLKDPSGYPRGVSPLIAPAEPLREVEISLSPVDRQTGALQLVGLRIYYDGETPNDIEKPGDDPTKPGDDPTKPGDDPSNPDDNPVNPDDPTKPDTSGVDETTILSFPRGVEYYDLQGRCLKCAPAHGIYLRKEGGKVRKMAASR